jgi:hypothetical protein
MNRLLKSSLSLCILLAASAGTAHAGQNGHSAQAGGAHTVAAKQGPQGGGLERLCNNHYNRLNLPVGKFASVNQIIDTARKSNPTELKAKLNASNITLEEASWDLYYLGQKSLGDGDFKSFIKYLTVSADDYLNPWAMVLLAKVYYRDKSEWQKQFPKSEITTDRNLEKSYVYLQVAFVIGGEIDTDYKDNSILTGVTNGGLALKDTFEGTGVKGFNPQAAINKNKAAMIEKVKTFKRLYEK